jgi:LacI family transcriptional regulator
MNAGRGRPNGHQPQRASRRVTIDDVAARAGVGVGTVSRVLNDHPAVTPETRARVRAAIESLDYHPNRAARTLSRRRSGTIAVVVPFFTQPSALARLQGVLDALDDTPYEVVLYNVDHAEQRRERLQRLLRHDVGDGLLVLSLRLTSDEVARLRQADVPAVVVDADTDDLPSVVVDNVEGGRLAARFLLGLGHRRIGYIGDAPDPRFGFTSSARRLEGLRAELEAAGSPLDPSLVVEGPHDRGSAREMALDLLRRPDPPTAIFAHADTQAIGVLDAAAELAIEVPRDLSVVGFDDIELAQLVGLTTVRQPLFDSGRLGAGCLLELIGGTAPSTQRVELPLELVARRTTGPVRRRSSRTRRAATSARSA